MATLDGTQLAKIVEIRGGDNDNMDLYLPATSVSSAQLRSCACWNWALCGGMCYNDQADTSPLRLYEENAPTDPFTDAPRNVYPRNYLDEPNLGNLWNTAKLPGATDQNRIDFMTAMARVSARKNGLIPVLLSSYEIHVTVPRIEWYHWQHWALAINYMGSIRFIQTEPNMDINWGFTRIWEANRPGYLTTKFCIQEIHQAHKDVIEAFLSMPMCRICKRVKPSQTGFNAKWHRCTGPGAHVYCGQCAYPLPRNGLLSRTRRCNAVPCSSATNHINDP